jgi:hypothetical protein
VCHRICIISVVFIAFGCIGSSRLYSLRICSRLGLRRGRQHSPQYLVSPGFVIIQYRAFVHTSPPLHHIGYRMVHPKGTAFVGETVRLDGETFDNCTFTDCTLIFSGGVPPNINNCVFQPPVSWNFDGAASNTLTFIQMLTSLSHEGAIALEKALDAVGVSSLPPEEGGRFLSTILELILSMPLQSGNY